MSPIRRGCWQPQPLLGNCRAPQHRWDLPARPTSPRIMGSRCAVPLVKCRLITPDFGGGVGEFPPLSATNSGCGLSLAWLQHSSAGPTISRGFAWLAPSAPFPNHLHAFQSGLAPCSLPTAPYCPPPARPTCKGHPVPTPLLLMPRHDSPRCRGQGGQPPTLGGKVGTELVRDVTPALSRSAAGPPLCSTGSSEPWTRPGKPRGDLCGAQRPQSSGCARAMSPGHVPWARPSSPSPAGSVGSPQRPAPAPLYRLLRLPGVHHQQCGLLAIHGQRALVRGLCKTPGEPSWQGTEPRLGPGTGLLSASHAGFSRHQATHAARTRATSPPPPPGPMVGDPAAEGPPPAPHLHAAPAGPAPGRRRRG